MSSVQHPTSRIASLDGLRALSILMVIVGHIAQNGVPSYLSSPAADIVWAILGNRMLGVAIFFGISGFLITRLLVEEIDRDGRIHLGNFYIRRCFRILPAFYTYLGFIAILTLLGRIVVRPAEFVYAGLFIWNYVRSATTWFLAHTWSLSVEEQFYLFWPTVLFLCGIKRARRVCIGLIVASPAIRVLFYLLFPSWRERSIYLLHTRMDVLMFGCWLGLVYNQPTWRNLVSGTLIKKLYLPVFVFLFCVTPFLIAHFKGTYLLPFGYTFEGASIALLIFWAVENPDSPVGRVLNSRVAVRVGVLSYSLYLWQQAFISEKHWSWWDAFPQNLAIIFVIAHVSYFGIEKPFLKFRRRFLTPGIRRIPEPPAL